MEQRTEQAGAFSASDDEARATSLSTTRQGKREGRRMNGGRFRFLFLSSLYFEAFTFVELL
jgi:hypothetical protein